MTTTAFNPWEINAADFPQTASIEAQLQFLLNYAVLAPSGHNTQPWQFHITGSTIELYADTSRSLPIADPQHRELVISCGAALYNLRLAMRHFGYQDQVTPFPIPSNPNLLARMTLGEPTIATATEEKLFAAISQRHTNRSVFQQDAVPLDLMDQWMQAAQQEGTWLHHAWPPEQKNAIADLVAEGDRIQMANGEFRQELAKWMHSGRSATHDGMPAYAQGVPEVLDFATPIVAQVLRTFDLGAGQAAKDRQLATGSPVIAILGTATDDLPSWLAAGQALEHVLLLARSAHVWASFLNQPVQLPPLRYRLRQLISTDGYPQIILRLGYCYQTVKPTPRRSIRDVMF